MNTHWQQLLITIPQDQAESLADYLEQYALSISMTDACNEPLYQEQPNERPLWQHVQIEALFAEDDPKVHELLQIISIDYPDIKSCFLNLLAEEDWVLLTQSQFPVQCFDNRLWVIPSWQTTSPEITGPVVRLDPGLAFGTGTHPTTQLCLEWLAEQSLNNKTCIDFGCGSGILALAALMLGAKSVWAIDHDPQAIQAIHNNAQLNIFPYNQPLNITDNFDQLPTLSTDIVIANILAGPLCELKEQFIQLVKPDGYLVLSGLLVKEASHVMTFYQTNFLLEDQREKDGWSCLVLRNLLT